MHALASGLPLWLNWFESLYWPMTSRWYAFTSSVGSTFFLPTVMISCTSVALRVYKKRTECHEEECHKHGKYTIEGGVRCCDDHHPALDERDEKDRGLVHKIHVAHLAHLDDLATQRNQESDPQTS